MNIVLPPESVDILSMRVKSLAGLSLAQCAMKYGLTVPENQVNHKGWIGSLMEKALGANAGSKPVPDFHSLGVELKTLPLGAGGMPSESTFVASITLKNIAKETWRTSAVWRKLAHVLWLPIEGARDIPLNLRRVGEGFFWQPSEAQEQLLKQDWCELTDLIATGKLACISAKLGQVLQVRPKGANGKSLSRAYGSDGESDLTLPRGFYLRAKFTQNLLQQNTQ